MTDKNSEPSGYIRNEISIDVFAKYRSGCPDTIVLDKGWPLTGKGHEALGEAFREKLGVDSEDEIYDRISQETVEQFSEYSPKGETNVPIAVVKLTNENIKSVEIFDEWQKNP